MFASRFSPLLRRLAPSIVLCFILPLLSHGRTAWKEITEEDRLAKPVNADDEAEFLRYERSFEGMNGSARLGGYCRAKIYSSRGADLASRLYIPFGPGEEPVQQAARVIKPDGTVRELRKEDFVLSRFGKKDKNRPGRMTFTLPELAPGDIFEYQWEGQFEYEPNVIQIPMQVGVPIRHLTFVYDAAATVTTRLVFWANAPEAKHEKRGEVVTMTMENIPAFREEPMMPPQWDCFIWAGAVRIPGVRNGAEAWGILSRSEWREMNDFSRPTDPVRAKAAELTKGCSDPMEKLMRLYAFCQRGVINVSHDHSAEAKAKLLQRMKAADELTPKYVLARGEGNHSEIFNLLFALSRAANLGPVLIRYPQTEYIRNVNTPQGWLFMTQRAIRYRFGDKNVILTFDHPYQPFALIPESASGASALVCEDNAETKLTRIPVPDPEDNRIVRKVVLELDENGGAKGTMEMVFEGERAWELKWARSESSPEEFDRAWIEDVRNDQGHFQVTGLVWENLTGFDYPLRARMNISSEDLAEPIGTRWSLPLNPFHYKDSPPLTAATRTYPIALGRPHQDIDEITYILPVGQELDAPSAPPSIGSPNSIFQVTYSAKYQKSVRKLDYRRELTYGRGHAIEIEAKFYAAVKKYFEDEVASDHHTLLFGPAAPIPASNP